MVDEENFLTKGTKVSSYQKRYNNYRMYFSLDTESFLMYCNDIRRLMDVLEAVLDEDEQCSLLIDSSKWSVKAVLLYNTNAYATIQIAYSMVIKEEYENMKILLEKIEYDKHRWKVCGDFKVIIMILGQ